MHILLLIKCGGITTIKSDRPYYLYPVKNLLTGSSLGNPFSFVTLDKESNIKSVWSSIDNQYYLGFWDVSIWIDGRELSAEITTFFPESQETEYSDGKGNIVVKKVFIPFFNEIDPEDAGKYRSVVYSISFKGINKNNFALKIQHKLCIPAVETDLFTKQPPHNQQGKLVDIIPEADRFIVRTQGSNDEVRIFGSKQMYNEYSYDSRELNVIYTIKNTTNVQSSFDFVFSFANNGTIVCNETFDSILQSVPELYSRSCKSYDEVSRLTSIITPEPLINRGIEWAKINTIRVQHRYRAGYAFTNDPPQDIVVVRDVAWYGMGADYLTPQFVKNMYDLIISEGVHDGGKLTEYIHADEDNPKLFDYGLNINDDTPLFVIGLFHHALLHGTESLLADYYQVMKNACEWIIAQMKDGLVYCTSDQKELEGICSWRNIIFDYNLSGAVTEINSECYKALCVTAMTAKQLGIENEADYFELQANKLKNEINKQLISEKTGLYALTKNNDGTLRHDITGDLVFPVLFGITDDEIKRKITDRLFDSEFWTESGLRTVSKYEHNYDPEFGYQLVGGVWPNITAWTAYINKDLYPGKLVEAMKNIYRISEAARPVDRGFVVPGEFPERLHGENLKSRGMPMSPWMPPTYLWLAVEGLLGIKPTLDGLEMNPALPAEWKWTSVVNVPYRNQLFSALFLSGIIYATHPVVSMYPVIVGSFIKAKSDNDKIFTVCFQNDSNILLFSVAEGDESGIIQFTLNDVTHTMKTIIKNGQANIFTFSLNDLSEVTNE